MKKVAIRKAGPVRMTSAVALYVALAAACGVAV
jgi:hypothetical protein